MADRCRFRMQPTVRRTAPQSCTEHRMHRWCRESRDPCPPNRQPRPCHTAAPLSWSWEPKRWRQWSSSSSDRPTPQLAAQPNRRRRGHRRWRTKLTRPSSRPRLLQPCSNGWGRSQPASPPERADAGKTGTPLRPLARGGGSSRTQPSKTRQYSTPVGRGGTCSTRSALRRRRSIGVVLPFQNEQRRSAAATEPRCRTTK